MLEFSAYPPPLHDIVNRLYNVGCPGKKGMCCLKMMVEGNLDMENDGK